MDASALPGSPDLPEAETRQALGDLARWWWAWLVAGILWIAASIIVLQFRQSSIVTASVIIGVLFLVAGVEEFVMASVSGGWRWLWIAVGIIFVLGGIYALLNPVHTFLAVASILGILLVLVGIFWIIEAFATSASDDIWWVRLIAGFVMIGLGFWVDSQLLATQAYTLLVVVGVWALLHGVTDIIKAFAIKKLGAMVAV